MSRPEDACEVEADRVAGSVAQFTGERGTPPAGERGTPPAARSGSGHPLDRATRAHFERRFGYDFGAVRVHRDRAAERAAEKLGAVAFTVGRDVVFGSGRYQPHTVPGRALVAHELTHVVQQDSGRRHTGPAIRRQTPRPAPGAEPNPGPTPGEMGDKLLKSFEKKFPDAAKLLRTKPSAKALVNEAAVKGVKFGGFAEDGPAKLAWSYTIGDTVYVTKTRTDPILAMKSFLFELNNAIRKPQFDENTKDAAEKKVTPKQFARRKVELEVEGLRRMGMIRFDIKKGDKKLDKYDRDFWFSIYQQYKSGKKTKAKIIDEVLAWKNGADPTKTNEQYYMDQYPK